MVWSKYIRCYNHIGENYRIKDRCQTALFYLNQALKTGLEKLGENHPDVAASYDHIGRTYWFKGDLKQALEFSLKGLRIRQQILGGNHLDVARSCESVGWVYAFQDHFDEAMNYFTRALAIRIKLAGENSLEAAKSYHALGKTYYLKRDLDESFKYARRSVAIKIPLLGEHHPEVADTYTDFANYYYYKGHYQEAIKYNQRSADIHRDFFGEYHQYVARSYVNIAHIYNDMGEYDRAIEYHHKSIAIFKHLFGENNFVAWNYQYLADVYAGKKDYAGAAEYFHKSLNLQLRLGKESFRQIGTLYSSLGNVYAKQSAFKQALYYYQKALTFFVIDFADSSVYQNPPLANIIGEIELLSCLQLKSEALERLYSTQSRDPKDLLMALSTCRLAADLVDKIRTGYREEISRLFLGEKMWRLYDKAIQTALRVREIKGDDHYKETAYHFAEKCKAAVLAQSLRESRAKEFAGISPELLHQEKELRSRLAYYETEIQKEQMKTGSRDREKLRQFEEKHFNLKRTYEGILEQFEASYPQYYNLKYKTQTASVPEVQTSLDPQTALIEYFVGDSSIYILTITKEGFEVTPVKKDSDFYSIVAALGNSFKSLSRKGEYIRSAARLYDLLIRPLERHINAKARWIVIPDGELYHIPFEALLSRTAAETEDYGDLAYLIKDHAISYHYSATLLLESLTQTQQKAYPGDFSGFAPVFAESGDNGRIPETHRAVFDTTRRDWDVRSVTPDGVRLKPLPYSEEELSTIVEMMEEKHKRSVGFLHHQATEENFKSLAKEYRYVHVATHGFVVDKVPNLSGIVFSQPTVLPSREDGILYSPEAYNLDLKADLVVLSSCESGVGTLVRGEGLMALTRGFLYAGAKNIIFSLWKVPDRHTYLLMVDLYKRILQGRNYSAVLQEAKLRMIAEPATAAPQSWASFVLIGG